MAAPASGGLQSPASTPNAVTIVLGPLLAIALLLLAAASISPAYIPWPRVAAGLHAHRLDLAMIGLGAVGTVFVVFSLQLLGS